MNQKNSVFQPGLTTRGPVYYGMGNMPMNHGRNYLNGLGAYLSALPALPSVAVYGVMAALLYLGYKKKIPFGVAGGAAGALAVWSLFPTAAQGSGAPSAADVSALTANAATVTVDPSTLSLPTPTLSGLGMYQIGMPSMVSRSPLRFRN